MEIHFNDRAKIEKTAAFALNSSFFIVFFVRVLYAPLGICWFLFQSLILSGQARSIFLGIRVLWVAMPVLVTKVSIDHFLGLVASIVAGTTTTLAQRAAGDHSK